MNPVAQLVRTRPRDLGGFAVRRMLPAAERRMVGPFVFFDHFGPVTLAPGEGMNVRPHPHIALATVTYLFEGEVYHRDSLGSALAIRPGAVNWMVAGRGIVHSERPPPDAPPGPRRMHGAQAWVALPAQDEECAPAFYHHPANTLPVLELEGASLRLIAGHGFGLRSPVQVASPTLYADLRLAPGAGLEIPAEHEERAIYVCTGAAACEAQAVAEGELAVLAPGAPVRVRSEAGAQLLLLGGAPLGERHIWWNFVSSSRERIERAKCEWREGLFPKVPGDELERIPLPGE